MSTALSRLYTIWMTLIQIVGILVISFGGSVFIALNVSDERHIGVLVSMLWMIPTLSLSILGMMELDKRKAKSTQ